MDLLLLTCLAFIGQGFPNQWVIFPSGTEIFLLYIHCHLLTPNQINWKVTISYHIIMLVLGSLRDLFWPIQLKPIFCAYKSMLYFFCQSIQVCVDIFHRKILSLQVKKCEFAYQFIIKSRELSDFKIKDYLYKYLILLIIFLTFASNLVMKK